MNNDLLDAYINIYKNAVDPEILFGKLFEDAYK